MITQSDLDECNAWIDASAEREVRSAEAEALETVSPTTQPNGEMAGARNTAELPASQPFNGTASAPAVLSFPRADQVQELGKMIETLRIVSEETRDGLIRIALAQECEGFPDFTHLDNATAHLRRLASDLFHQLAECEQRLAMARYQKRTRTA